MHAVSLGVDAPWMQMSQLIVISVKMQIEIEGLDTRLWMHAVLLGVDAPLMQMSQLIVISVKMLIQIEGVDTHTPLNACRLTWCGRSLNANVTVNRYLCENADPDRRHRHTRLWMHAVSLGVDAPWMQMLTREMLTVHINVLAIDHGAWWQNNVRVSNIS